MLRPASRAFALFVLSLALSCVQATAANPSPPPGSVQVQPVSASAGSPGQSGSTAGVSTGQAWAGSSSQATTAAHCGVNAGAGSTGYSAQPQQVDSSGASSPDCTSVSGNGSQSTAGLAGTQGRTSTAGTGTGSTTTGGATSGANSTGSKSFALKPAASVTGLAWFGQWFGWFLLLLLLAIVFLLLGVAIGRRRREPASA
jgi:cobalamin biosynthesis Mg chelatase CobN